MNDLTVRTGSGKSLSTPSAGVSPRVWRILADLDIPPEAAQEAILSTPGMLEEVRASMPALEASFAPAGPAFVVTEMTKWSLVFDPGNRQEIPEFWAPYKRALADLPKRAILEAMADYEKLADATFLPKPGPLRQLVQLRMAPQICALGRARAALRATPRRRITPLTQEQRQQLREEVLAPLKQRATKDLGADSGPR